MTSPSLLMTWSQNVQTVAKGLMHSTAIPQPRQPQGLPRLGAWANSKDSLR